MTYVYAALGFAAVILLARFIMRRLAADVDEMFAHFEQRPGVPDYRPRSREAQDAEFEDVQR